jgi:DNA-binding LacI/PurR family transcriptional regulator
MAVHHLYEHGHRRIGLVVSRASPTSAYLERGWRRACADLGVADTILTRESAALDGPAQREAVNTLLTECRRHRITALIVHSDPDAVAIARACAERGVCVPDDLALVSCDDEAAQDSDPTLTAVRPPKNHVGRLAVELMVTRLIDGERRPAQRVLVAPELVVRQSSLPVRHMSQRREDEA